MASYIGAGKMGFTLKELDLTALEFTRPILEFIQIDGGM